MARSSTLYSAGNVVSSESSVASRAPKDEHGRLFSEWRGEWCRTGAVDRNALSGPRLATLNAEPFDLVRARFHRDLERIRGVGRLKDHVLASLVRQGEPGRAQIAARFPLGEVQSAGQAHGIAHRPTRRLERVEGHTIAGGGIGRIGAADESVVHEDRMVATDERLPRPQGVGA